MFRLDYIRNATIALVASVLLTAAASAGSDKPFFENNVNRWGADYSVFSIQSGGANACYQACAKDKQCLAWTFHRPGTKGKLGECHLKSKAAHGRSNPCCISGVLVGQGAAQDDHARAGVVSGRLSTSRLTSRSRATQKREAQNLFQQAKLTHGRAIGLPELTIAAAAPPMKITPVSYATSDEF